VAPEGEVTYVCGLLTNGRTRTGTPVGQVVLKRQLRVEARVQSLNRPLLLQKSAFYAFPLSDPPVNDSLNITLQ
jgi:hypothetical protein